MDAVEATGTHPDTMHAGQAPPPTTSSSSMGLEVDLRPFGLGVYNADAAVEVYDAMVKEMLSHEVIRTPLDALKAILREQLPQDVNAKVSDEAITAAYVLLLCFTTLVVSFFIARCLLPRGGGGGREKDAKNKKEMESGVPVPDDGATAHAGPTMGMHSPQRQQQPEMEKPEPVGEITLSQLERFVLAPDTPARIDNSQFDLVDMRIKHAPYACLRNARPPMQIAARWLKCGSGSHSYNVYFPCRFDGVQNQRTLISLRGVVYDVSRRPDMYGPGSAYGFLAGKDASRALAEMSIDESLVNKSLEGLSQQQIDALHTWETFFKNKYAVCGACVDSPAAAQ